MRTLVLLVCAWMLAGCAGPTLNAKQERVYAAVADCNERTSANVLINWVDPDGLFSWRSTMSGLHHVRFKQCLRDQHGFRFGGDPGFRGPSW